MSNVEWSVPISGYGPTRNREHYHNISEGSARNGKGQLILSDHNHLFDHSRVVSYAGPDNWRGCQGAETANHYLATTSDINDLYARVQGKLRGGGASLGVTLASMGQSMEMISNRFLDVNNIMQVALRRRRNVQPIRRNRGARARMLADDVLEVQFGWKPFIDDIFNALNVMTSNHSSPIRVGATKQISNPYPDTVSTGEPSGRISWTGKARIRVVATYTVTNPNLWLANRLGLVNPFQVAWDRVPWSWVVNMFVNTNQLIGSLTDEMGLERLSGSLTTSSVLLREQTIKYSLAPYAGWTYRASTLTKHRNRTGLNTFTPSLQFRVPDLGLGLAVTASALAVQRSQRLASVW